MVFLGIVKRKLNFAGLDWYRTNTRVGIQRRMKESAAHLVQLWACCASPGKLQRCPGKGKMSSADLLFSLASEVGQDLQWALFQPWNPFPWITSRAYVVMLSPCWESPRFSSFLWPRPWVALVMSLHPSPQQFPFGQLGVGLLLGMLPLGTRRKPLLLSGHRRRMPLSFCTSLR